jgi:uncharacterized protein (DUF1697 family)
MMHTYIALFRGINVGGSNLLPMRELVTILESLGLKDVSTYIQSGNAVFGSNAQDVARLASKIRGAIEEARGFKPGLMLLTVEELKRAIASNPFPEEASDPKRLHVFFLGAVPSKPDLASLESIKSRGERFALHGKVFYLHAPNGIGRSKLATSVEKLLGVSATARNWRTVVKVLEMASR